MIDDLPVMMHGQTFQLEIKKYLVQSNFPIIENLLDIPHETTDERERLDTLRNYFD